MTSDNVFSDWLTSLVTFFDKTLYSTRKKSREVNIIFQSSSRHLKIEMVFPNFLKSSSQSSLGYVLSSTNQMLSYTIKLIMAVVGQTAYMPTLTIYAKFLSLLPPTDIRCFPTYLKKM
jgi:hypothetical protein